MDRTILVCGHGGGISDAVARKFGAQGFRVGLVARNEARVVEAAGQLGAAGIEARGFGCDLGDAQAVRALIDRVRAELGPITVLHWNAYAPLAGDFTAATPDALHTVFDVAVTGMVVAMQASLEDLRQQEGAAILVTGGGFALADPNVDAMIVKFESMGLGLAKAAQHKLVGLLNKRLANDDIYVGEVMVMGLVKGTASDQGHATIEPATVADAFWDIYQKRSTAYTQVG